MINAEKNIKRIALLAFIAAALLCFAGCAVDSFMNVGGEKSVPSNESEREETIQNALPIKMAAPWRAAFKEILLGETEFFSTDSNKNLNIRRLAQALTSDESLTATAMYFALIDLDYDGTPEVVLGLKLGENDDIGYEVLRYQDGVVYGYTLFTRQFNDLKHDGTFQVSSGAGEWGICTIAFDKNTYETNEFTYCKSYTSLDGSWSELYFVNHQSAAEDEFRAAVDQQDKKAAAVWCEFTKENIEQILLLSFDYQSTVDGIGTVQLVQNTVHGTSYSDGVKIVVTLGDENTLTKQYDEPCRNPYLLYADLTGNGVAEIILALPNPTSSYSATDIHVLEIDGDELVEILTVLDNPPEVKAEYRQTLFEIPGQDCSGVSTVLIGERPALKIRHNGRKDIPYSVLLWNGGEWVVAEQGTETY